VLVRSEEPILPALTAGMRAFTGLRGRWMAPAEPVRSGRLHTTGREGVLYMEQKVGLNETTNN